MKGTAPIRSVFLPCEGAKPRGPKLGHVGRSRTRQTPDVVIKCRNTWGGLSGVPEKFLVFDATGDDKDATRYLFTSVYSAEEGDWDFNFGGKAEFPRQAWINGEQVISVSSEAIESQKTVNLRKGWNSILQKTPRKPPL